MPPPLVIPNPEWVRNLKKSVQEMGFSLDFALFGYFCYWKSLQKIFNSITKWQNKLLSLQNKL